MTASISAEVDYFTTVLKLGFWGVMAIAFYFTKGYAVNYYFRMKSVDEFKSLLYIQVFILAAAALLLPNMVLDRYAYFHNIYERNPLWIPFSMAVILFVLLMLFGLLYDGITAASGRANDTMQLDESSPKWIHKAVKHGSHYYRRKLRMKQNIVKQNSMPY